MKAVLMEIRISEYSKGEVKLTEDGKVSLPLTYCDENILSIEQLEKILFLARLKVYSGLIQGDVLTKIVIDEYLNEEKDVTIDKDNEIHIPSPNIEDTVLDMEQLDEIIFRAKSKKYSEEV